MPQLNGIDNQTKKCFNDLLLGNIGLAAKSYCKSPPVFES